MRLLALATLASALAVGLAWGTAPQGRAAPTRTVASADVFQGLGTWIDVYDTSLYASPNAVAARLAGRGVRTAWVETANDRSTTDVVDPTGLGRFVDALHARGIRVVGGRGRCSGSARRRGAASTASRSTSSRCGTRT